MKGRRGVEEPWLWAKLEMSFDRSEALFDRGERGDHFTIRSSATLFFEYERSLFEDDVHLPKGKGFGQVVLGAEANGGDCRFERPIARDHHDVSGRIGGTCCVQHGEAVGARHRDVGEHDAAKAAGPFERRHSGPSISGAGDPPAAFVEKVDQDVSNRPLIVGDEGVEALGLR